MFHSPCSPSWYSMIHSSNNSRRCMICSFKSPCHIPRYYLFSLVIPPLPGLAVPSCRQHPYPLPKGTYRSPAPVVPHGAWPAVAGLAVPTRGPPSLPCTSGTHRSPAPDGRRPTVAGLPVPTQTPRSCCAHPTPTLPVPQILTGPQLP